VGLLTMALSPKHRGLLRLSTAIVLGNWDEVRRLRAAPQAEPDREWRETVLQTHLFAGFPRLVQAFGVLAEGGGLGTVGGEEIEGSPIPPERGTQLFDSIYGDGADSVRALLDGYHADFGAWIAEHAYARVLARPGLAPPLRELLAACALAALGQERQLASHARGSLRLGAGFDDLWEAFDTVADLLEPGRLERARRIAERFRE